MLLPFLDDTRSLILNALLRAQSQSSTSSYISALTSSAERTSRSVKRPGLYLVRNQPDLPERIQSTPTAVPLELVLDASKIPSSLEVNQAYIYQSRTTQHSSIGFIHSHIVLSHSPAFERAAQSQHNQSFPPLSLSSLFNNFRCRSYKPTSTRASRLLYRS
jgi:hypothetical protein